MPTPFTGETPAPDAHIPPGEPDSQDIAIYAPPGATVHVFRSVVEMQLWCIEQMGGTHSKIGTVR